MALNGGQRGDVWGGGGEKQKLTDAVGGRCGVYFVCVGVLAAAVVGRQMVRK